MHEPDERFNLGVGKTRDGSLPHDRVRQPHNKRVPPAVLSETPERHPSRSLAPAPRRPGVLPGAPRRHSSTSAPTTQVATSASSPHPSTSPGREHWQELLLDQLRRLHLRTSTSSRLSSSPAAAKLGLPVMDVHPFAAVGALGEDGAPKKDGSHSKRSEESPHLSLGPASRIAFPEPTYSAHPHVNREFDTTRLPLQLPIPRLSRRPSTNTTPTTAASNAPQDAGSPRRLRSRPLCLRARHDHRSRRCAKCPVSIVYRRDQFKQRRHQSALRLWLRLLRLRASGQLLRHLASRSSTAASSSPTLTSAVAARWAIPWHDAGKMMQKLTTFTDFTTAVEQLTQQGLRRPRPRRHRGWQRRRPAHGSRREPAAQTCSASSSRTFPSSTS